MILPSPASAFQWVQLPIGPALVCRALEPFARHVFTTRHWPLGSRTLPADDGGSDGDEAARWCDVADALDVDAGRLVRVRQVHGAEVAVARAGSDVRPEADIIVSGDDQCALAIRVADCVPLLMADRRTGAVAAAHAGWRGLAAGVPAATVAALAREYGSRPVDLIAAAGPSIGACCYEVGPEVRDRFARAGFAPSDLDRWFSAAPRSGHSFFDGWAATRDQLVAAGLSPEQIFVSEMCTASHPDAFCSYRRDGSAAGRLAGAIRWAGHRS
jgi:YfiH family protein